MQCNIKLYDINKSQNFCVISNETIADYDGSIECSLKYTYTLINNIHPDTNFTTFSTC